MVSISDDILSAVPISEAELRLEIAIMLYQKGLPPGGQRRWHGSPFLSPPSCQPADTRFL